MLKLNSIGHFVADHYLFQNLNLSLAKKKYGLVGPNGVGKSTLAKIAAGLLPPSEGHVQRQGEIVYLAQHELQTEQSVAEYLAEIWERPSTDTELTSQILGSLDLGKKTIYLSGGEWMKVRIAKAISLTPSLLILDEPSNNLDRSGKEILLSFVRNYTHGLWIISHDRELLGEVDTILELSNQGLSVYGGNFEDYSQQRSHERKNQLEHLGEQKRIAKKKEIEREEKIETQEKRMRRGKKEAASGSLPRILVGGRKRRAQVSLGRIERDESESVQKAKNEMDQAWQSLKKDPFFRLDFSGSKSSPGKNLLTITDLQWKFHEATEELWREPITLTIRGGDRLHIQGENASGKSTLLKLIVNARQEGQRKGEIQANASMAYLDQKYSGLNPEKTILENMRETSQMDETALRNELAFYGFTADKVFQKVNSLSGGEILKASLAQIFLGKKPELLLLDEPTNNLDLQSLEILELALQKFEGSLAVVSHDAEFVERLQVGRQVTLVRQRR